MSPFLGLSDGSWSSLSFSSSLGSLSLFESLSPVFPPGYSGSISVISGSSSSIIVPSGLQFNKPAEH